MRVSLPSMRACGKRDACADTPDTVTAETFAEESEMFDIDMMTSIWLSPDRSRAGCVSPLSCFMGGGGGDIAWCSPSRVLVTTDTLAKEIDHNDDAELALNSMTATPLDFSFDSAHGIEMYSRDSAENPTEGRAAFVSATAFDCGRNPRGVGLSVGCFQGRLLISSKGQGVFSESPIRIGDELISINGKSCNAIMTGGQATRIINNIEGILSVVVSTGHDSGFIESMIVKPKPGCKTGLGMQFLEGSLKILRLDPAGLWAHSLLNEGNHVISINGSLCSQFDGYTAGALVNSSQRMITILARSIKETSVVVEQQEQSTTICLTLFQNPPLQPGINEMVPSCLFYGPCFQKGWSPAKIAHVAANGIILVVPGALCIGFGRGIMTMAVSFVLGFLIANLPWLGWKSRRGSLCSIGQICSTLLVLFCCAVLLPVFLANSLPISLFQSIGIALPLTILANLSMHFTDDGIEYYTIRSPGTNNSAHGPRGGVDIIEDNFSV